MADVRGSYNTIHLNFNADETINASFSDLVKAIESDATVDLIMITLTEGAFTGYTCAILVYVGIVNGLYKAEFYDGHENTKLIFTATDPNAQMTFTEP